VTRELTLSGNREMVYFKREVYSGMTAEAFFVSKLAYQLLTEITSAVLLARPLSFFTNGSYRDFTFTGFLVFPVFSGLRNFLWIFTPTEKNAGVLSVFTILVLTLAVVLGTSYPAIRQADLTVFISTAVAVYRLCASVCVSATDHPLQDTLQLHS
jgi:hypothetical protein